MDDGGRPAYEEIETDRHGAIERKRLLYVGGLLFVHQGNDPHAGSGNNAAGHQLYHYHHHR
jgi:hypothetical protein